MSSVVFGCPQCHKGVELEPESEGSCRHCGESISLGACAEPLCAACGCEEIYSHRDFNQKLGIFIIAVGVVLWLWLDNFLPMIVAAVIDLVFYFLLPNVGICYRCKAHYRGFAWIAKLGGFDLERHEHYRWEKATGTATGEPPAQD